ncbi:MAG: cyclopropane-fatty-acyl-phospholipid synthase family protein [Bacteriovoracaceae bacterium]|nr:cyclopropane-fatty-acyl-phospholipid synthase family protein [Bacteriovoracaceae bacterium]
MEIAKIREAFVALPIAKQIVESVLARIKNGSILLKSSDGRELLFGDSNSIPLTVEVTDERFYMHCLLYGDIGFGEAYTEGWWDSNDVTGIIKLLINNMQEIGGMSGSNKTAGNLLKVLNRGAYLLRSNTEKGAKKNIQEHYDLSNDFYKLWLDETMTYSSAYWKTPQLSLKEAQIEKWRSLAENLEIKKEDEVLEIGTGWGGFSCFLAKEYGCRITTVTISEEQFKYSKDLFEREGVSHLINLQLQDYRKITGKFDKIVSIEMMEAIGHQYLPVFFKVLSDRLKKDGLISYQVITCADSRYEEYRSGVDWIQKHIFPGALLPSVGHMTKVMNEVSELQLVKFRDMGPHYAKTLNIWDKKFIEVKNQVEKLGFDSRFQRKWHYYLNYCEAAFETRNISVVQMTLTRPNNAKLVSEV